MHPALLAAAPDRGTIIVLTVHLLATAAMVGLIWFVQIVHYPLFAAVGRPCFDHYAQRHQHLTSFVVGPFMAAEGATAVWLAIDPPAGVSRWLALAALAVLGVVLGSTVLLQVPRHAVLANGYDETRARSLVTTNWIRTVGWTTRGVLAAVMLVAAVSR
jgi:hypothetical protein